MWDKGFFWESIIKERLLLFIIAQVHKQPLFIERRDYFVC